MKDLKLITFEEFVGERKSIYILSERDEELHNISQPESLKEFKKPEIVQTISESEKPPAKSFNERLKEIIIYILTHDTYIRE